MILSLTSQVTLNLDLPMYLKIADGKVATTVEAHNGRVMVNLDLDKDGNLLGVEVV